MIRAVAWDIDGTLVDSEPLHLLALKQICATHGVDISDLPDDHFIGVHLGNVWRELEPRNPTGLTFEVWLRGLNEVYRDNVHRLTEVDFAADTIRQLAAMGLIQIAVSNSNRIVVDTNLQKLGVEEHFATSISLDDVLEGKPDPFPYRMACARLCLPSCAVLAVEDSRTGAASARSAGLPLAFLTVNDAPENANVISCLSELPALIEEISRRGFLP